MAGIDIAERSVAFTLFIYPMVLRTLARIETHHVARPVPANDDGGAL